jgi:hypothetical protein
VRLEDRKEIMWCVVKVGVSVSMLFCCTAFSSIANGDAPASIAAPSSTNSAQSAATLVGTWDVSLRFAPDAPPSKTDMQITAVNDGQLEGSFYGTPFSLGRAVLYDGKWVVAAKTGDLTGPYWHSGRVQADGAIEGQTLSEGRAFLMTWRAVRK